MSAAASLNERMRDALREFVEVPAQLTAEAEQLEAKARAKRKEAREAKQILVLKGLIEKPEPTNGNGKGRVPPSQRPAVSTDKRALKSQEKIRAILPQFGDEEFSASAAANKAGLSWQAGSRAVKALWELGELRRVGIRAASDKSNTPTVYYRVVR
jgi:hypothetical protein